ncbi:MAG: glycoside hydrolase family 97 N-terminal domain-containing protein, partial [Bacteroidales bacterium]|nr:glycoside hydrolase family 97 N-terminal domain-containing protein [Bacteroidales bacterium]
MNRILQLLLLTLFFFSCTSHKTEVSSPDKNIRLAFNIDNEGFMSYNIKVNDSIFIDDSQLGFEAKDGLNLKNSFEIIKTEFSSKDETWNQIWGENKTIRNHYNEMAVHLANIDSTYLTMRFRLFNDGLGFRYEYRIKDTDKIILTDELTTFNIKENGVSWSIP